MRITEADVAYVANLARLNIEPQDVDEMMGNLNEILNHMDDLGKLDTEGVEPTAHVRKLRNIMREDIKMPSMDREVLLKNAPDSEDGCFRVPQVVE